MRIACLVAALLAATQASADSWRMLDDSEFLFQATWDGNALDGRFNEFDVQLDAESGGLTEATLIVTVNLAGADMQDPDMNEAISGDDWFGVAEYPQAAFKSQSIVESGPAQYSAKGELNLKGITRPVEVPFTWSESKGSAEMRGELLIDRTEFNVGSGEWAGDESIGADVRLSFKIKLVAQ